MEGVGAASRMDKENDTFKHVWTRAKTRESKSSTWNDKTKLDIVRPGRYSYSSFYLATVCAQYHALLMTTDQQYWQTLIVFYNVMLFSSLVKIFLLLYWHIMH